ncbi:MAG: DUF2298 domain-containing protein [Halobacteriaceae archaeon]
MALDYLPPLVWLALFVGLGAVALPGVAVVCRRLVDCGAGLALPAALATLAAVGYWVGQWRFGPVAAVAGVGVLVVGSGVALLRGVRPDWRRYVGVVLVFAAAYFFMLTLRAVDPGAWPGGGEKFLDFGLLASLLRAGRLPPEDVWFAGEPVRYYYGGHMLAALLAELTNTPAQYAYNYALAGYYAAFVASAYGLAGTLAAGAGRSYEGAGALAAFFVGLASNLAPPIRLLSWALPWTGGERLLAAFGLEAKGLAGGPGEFNYWFASRVVDGGMAPDGPWQHINEFPFFAFLNGDLHGHMMSPPFLLLVAGLGYAYYRTPGDVRARERLVPLAAAAPVVGLLALVNTWSVPTGFGLLALTLVFAPAPSWTLLPRPLRAFVPGRLTRPGPAHEVARIGSAALALLPLAALAAATVLPFLLGPASGRAIGFLPTPRADLPGLIVVFGPFLAISVAYLLGRVPGAVRALRRPRVVAGLFALFAVTWLYRATAVFLFVPPLALAWWGLRRGDITDAPAPCASGAGERTRRRPGGAGRTSLDAEGGADTGLGYVAILLIGVLGLLVIVEFAYVVEDAGPGRYNTVFKTYAQVWALWSVVAGVCLHAVVDPRGALASFVADGRGVVRRVRARLPSSLSAGSGGRHGVTASAARGRERSRWYPAWLPALLVGLLLVSMSLYAGFGTAWQLENNREDYTLDARAFVAEQHPGEYEAIQWLASLEGQPNMASAPGTAIYQWVNGPSSLTGIPTVAGWAHEIGYRGRDVYEARVADVNTLFTGTPDARAAMLRRYDVRYIYVGPVERERYAGADLTFDDEPGISVAHRSGDVVIYGVNRSALTPSQSAGG